MALESTNDDHGRAGLQRTVWLRRFPILFVVLLPFGLLLQVYIYYTMAGGSALQAAIAVADRLDPGWQLEELKARREVIPDEENAALQVIKIVGIEGGSTGLCPLGLFGPRFNDAFGETTPHLRLTPIQAALLQVELAHASLAREEARKLADMPKGRFPVSYTYQDMQKFYPQIMSLREICDLLTYDSIVLTEEGRFDEAMRSSQAGIQAARTLAREPGLLPALARIALQEVMLSGVERVLAQSEPSDSALENLQQVLADCSREPLTLFAIRGERALEDYFLRSVESGHTSLSAIKEIYYPDEIVAGSGSRWEIIEKARLMYKVGPIRRHHAEVLRFYNQLVEIGQQPIDEQFSKLELARTGSAIDSQPIQNIAAGVQKIILAQQRHLALLNSTVVAIAAERFRQERGRWPERIEELIPAYCSSPPSDPFAKGSVRLVRSSHGLIVYTVGLDGVDDGGKLDPHKAGMKRGTDVGLKLFDPDRRRQPAETSGKEKRHEQGTP